ELRQRLPRTMFIDLEADNLLGHPDFLHASRGALAMASANLNPRPRGNPVFDLSTSAPASGTSATQLPVMQVQDPCHAAPDPVPGLSRNRPVAAWSSDGQALLSRAVSRLTDVAVFCKGTPQLDTSGKATIQVVSLEGFKPVSRRLAAPENWPTKFDFY